MVKQCEFVADNQGRAEVLDVDHTIVGVVHAAGNGDEVVRLNQRFVQFNGQVAANREATVDDHGADGGRRAGCQCARRDDAGRTGVGERTGQRARRNGDRAAERA